jgi:PAS domain S-box-containing protein
MTDLAKNDIDIIFDSTYDGMIAINSDGIVTLFNKAAERITGRKAKEMIGKPAVEVIPNTRLHHVLAEGVAEIGQEQNLGNTVIVTNRVPIRDANGDVRGAVAIFRDITEIKNLTSTISNLWNVRSLLEAVIESTADAISVADEKGNNIIVNPAYTRITGMPREAVIGKHATVDIAEGESMHMKVLQTGKPVKNVRMKVGPGKKEVIVNVAPIYIEGIIRGSVGVIQDISEIITLNEELAHARKIIRQLKARYTWEDIIGRSPAISLAKEQARRAAETPATVLLRGESGTGKELFAHAIHNASSRKKGQFVRINCAALAQDLLESELFGYEEGAFTGAMKGGKIGLFEEASRGTIFMDEIGEIGLSLQKKLLRVLQEREITRVGSTIPIPIDVRVIAATNANLEQKVKEGSFREDLYYRLNVIPILIPPLREIKDDISFIVEHLIFKLNQSYGREVLRMSGDALSGLMQYHWPGNVRELESVIARAMINMKPNEKIIEILHLPLLECEKVSEVLFSAAQSTARTLDQAVAEAERAAIIRALQDAGGNRQNAANLLNTALRNLYYKIKKYNISA